MQRRSFLKSVGTMLGVAVIAPQMAFSTPRHILYADGIHDDSEVLQAWVDGEEVYYPNGQRVSSEISHKRFRISKPIDFSHGEGLSFTYNHIHSV